MHNLAPRGIRATCVPTSICFATGSSYYDVEEVLVREQPNVYRPDIQGNRGVITEKFLGNERKLFGHKFTRVSTQVMRLYDFCRKFANGTYLVRRKGHMFVVKDGEVFDLLNHDWMTPILDAWKVEKIS